MEMQLSGRGCRPTKSAYSQEHQGFESLGFRRVLSCSSVKFKSIYLVFLSQRGEPDYAPEMQKEKSFYYLGISTCVFQPIVTAHFR